MFLQKNLARCNLKTGCSLSSIAPEIAPRIPPSLEPRSTLDRWPRSQPALRSKPSQPARLQVAPSALRWLQWVDGSAGKVPRLRPEARTLELLQLLLHGAQTMRFYKRDGSVHRIETNKSTLQDNTAPLCCHCSLFRVLHAYLHVCAHTRMCFYMHLSVFTSKEWPSSQSCYCWQPLRLPYNASVVRQEQKREKESGRESFVGLDQEGRGVGEEQWGGGEEVMWAWADSSEPDAELRL